MRNRIESTLISSLILAWCAIGDVHADPRPLASECATRDRAAVEWIETLADNVDVNRAVLAESALGVLRARNTCVNGKFAEALGLYARVILPLVVMAAPQQLKNCAGLDLQLISSIEDAGEQGAVDSDKLWETTEGVMRARQSCQRGDFALAMRQYEGLAGNLKAQWRSPAPLIDLVVK